MKEEISKILDQYVDAYGFVSTKEYEETRSSLGRNDLYDDYSFLEEYKTIITLGLSYPSVPLKWEGKGTGLLSKYSYGTDYHLVFRNRMNHIEEELNQLGIKCKTSVDTYKVDERWASYVSGLGFLGKNQFLIHKTYGTYMYLATILIDKDIEKDFTLLDTCGTCRKCIDACPSGALDHGFDINLCISETSQSKRDLTETEIKYMKTMVYGCDICQKVCPKNKGINFEHNKEFLPSGIESIDLIALLKMSNKEYMKIYKDNASSWKGGTVMKRNALCLLANQRVYEAVDVIRESLDKYRDISWYNSVAKKVLEMLER